MNVNRLRDHFDRLFDTPTTLPQLRQAILQLAVQGQLVPQDPNDEPIDRAKVRAEHMRCWKDKCSGKYTEPANSNLEQNDSIPKSWCWVTLEELADPVQPISYGILKPGPYVDGGIRMLRIMDLRNGVISDRKPHRVSQELSDQYSRTLLSGGEVLISLVGTIGLCTLVPPEFTGSNIHRNLGVVMPGAYVDAQYLLNSFNSITVQSQITEATTGSNQPLFNLGDLKPLAIPVPPLSEQKRIVCRR